ncbi:MAG: adenosylcobinamide-GDP ribazoletransferase [Muribaculaceae bacterium]|nr:adenosylcobinamide-GDP ribazoletransferase [Muribaculaceae bacterium]
MKRIAAALTFFTRIPLWKWTEIPQTYYSSVVVYWPLTGWVTGGFTALLLWLAAQVFPMLPAVVVALTGRTLLTGALHEDGLADLCDGFGGGTTKDRILAIMKDSHIGTYGVIGLIFYYLWFVSLVVSLPLEIAVAAIFASDTFAKTCAAQLVNLLPYSRPEGAKNRISYERMSIWQALIVILTGLLPVCMLTYMDIFMAMSIIAPIIVISLLILYMRHKIGGYTGDCCGAACLLCELSMLAAVAMIYNVQIL